MIGGLGRRVRTSSYFVALFRAMRTGASDGFPAGGRGYEEGMLWIAIVVLAVIGLVFLIRGFV